MERDCGVIIDMFHRNVIFILNNSEKREYQERTGNQDITMMLHGEPIMNTVRKSIPLS